MPAFRLITSSTESPPADEEPLFWLSDDKGSFRTTLGPTLSELGHVPPPNIDLVRIAAAVYGADRSVPRAVGRVNWSRRDMELHVPVFDPDAWSAVGSDLSTLLGFLSGDTWTLSFRAASESPPSGTRAAYPDAQHVALLSGGADSAVGAVHLRQTGADHVLVSHVGATNIAPVQRQVAREVESLLPDGGRQHHVQLSFTRRLRQPDGVKFRNETSTRTRSLLFLSLGLGVSSGTAVPLWIAENGFASLNPPLGADQRGSLSTRTTHPTFLTGLGQIASVAGAHAVIANPFEAQTKGEMFAGIAEQLGANVASRLMASTHSCSHTGQRSHHVPVGSQCGECFGCLLRRAAFAASGVHDRTDYLSESPNSTISAFVASHSMRRSVAAFVERGITDRDIAAMALPADYSLSQARDLCERAIAELRLVTS